MKTLVAVIALAGVLASANAHAQQGTDLVTTYGEGAFTDELVVGDLVRPDGDLVRSRFEGSRVFLIRLRQNFVPEMLKSVEHQ